MTEQVGVFDDRPSPATGAAAPHVLDRVVWAALHGPQAAFAERHGRAVRFHPEVSSFAALDDETDLRAWADAARMVGPGGVLMLPAVGTWPTGWRPVFRGECLQMVGAGAVAEADAEAVALGPGDVPEMLDLIARTEPGPFQPRTIELGAYLGIRRGGALVAMAGERLRPPGWTEISAVCTDPAYRGQGLAGRLVRAVAAGILERGERPCLHVLARNTNAVRLYDALGFEVRREIPFTGVVRD